MSELESRIRQSVGFGVLPSGTLVDVNRLPQMDIIQLQHRVDHYGAVIADLSKTVNLIRETKVKEFRSNDVYEVNKRIERIEQRLALLESNQRRHQFNSFIILFLSVNMLLISWVILWLN